MRPWLNDKLIHQIRIPGAVGTRPIQRLDKGLFELRLRKKSHSEYAQKQTLLKHHPMIESEWLHRSDDTWHGAAPTEKHVEDHGFAEARTLSKLLTGFGNLHGEVFLLQDLGSLFVQHRRINSPDRRGRVFSCICGSEKRRHIWRLCKIQKPRWRTVMTHQREPLQSVVTRRQTSRVVMGTTLKLAQGILLNHSW